jgi:hypothetical protein
MANQHQNPDSKKMAALRPFHFALPPLVVAEQGGLGFSAVRHFF